MLQRFFLAFKFVEDSLVWELFLGSMQTGTHTYTLRVLFGM